MKATILTLTLALTSPAFAADSGHFPMPSGGGTVVDTPSSGRVPACQDKARLTNYYKELRQKAREGYARKIAEAIPTLKTGTKCIPSKEAFDARYMPSGDYFLISCLAETKGRLTHVYTMELISEIPACFSDQTIQNFVNSSQCQRAGEPEKFERYHLLNCPMQAGPEPKFRGASGVHPIDPAYFARLINARPSVQNIVDGRNFKVKIGRTTGSGSITSDDGCNAGGCLPGFNNSRDVK